MRTLQFLAVWLVVGAAALGRDVRVTDSPSLRAAVREAQPGDRIALAGGVYAPDVYLEAVHGAPGRPITLEGESYDNPPVFVGGQSGIQVAGFSHLVLRNLHVRGAAANGINLDDAGHRDRPSHHLVVEHVTVEDVGPDGNFDGLKLSGVTDFVIRGSTIRGWGGQAIDLVGCHRGIIEQCHIEGKGGFSQSTGPQFKGGTSEVVLRDSLIRNAGGRAVNIGGSTGLAFFRPPGVLYEARDITVERCAFEGGTAAVAFVGVDGALVRDCTIDYPRKWLVRILQETREPGFVPSRNGRLERNRFRWRHADCPTPINIGDATAPDTFGWSGNTFIRDDRPDAGAPSLPGRVEP